jgi:hypothetical protein
MTHVHLNDGEFLYHVHKLQSIVHRHLLHKITARVY